MEPGWIIDLKDKVIFKPTKDSDIYKFYTSSAPKDESTPNDKSGPEDHFSQREYKKDGTESKKRLKYPPYYPYYLPPGNTY